MLRIVPSWPRGGTPQRGLAGKFRCAGELQGAAVTQLPTTRHAIRLQPDRPGARGAESYFAPSAARSRSPPVASMQRYEGR